MDVVVSRHAIKRYRKRTFDFSQWTKKSKLLARVVQARSVAQAR